MSLVQNVYLLECFKVVIHDYYLMAQNAQEDASDHSDDADGDEITIFVYFVYSFRNTVEFGGQWF